MPRKAPHICILSDGRRVPFSLKQRHGEPFYFACFRGLDNVRLERSTKEKSKKRAEDAAAQLIKQEFDPNASGPVISWDEVLPLFSQKLKDGNLRERTVEDYLEALGTLRKVFPASKGPADITPIRAEEFKSRRAGEVAAETLSGNLNKLRVIWAKWFLDAMGIVSANPWADVEKPKLDEPIPRYLRPDESQAFFDWIEGKFPGWRLPVLFFKTKLITGRRITMLCSLATSGLIEGRIMFEPAKAKSRKLRHAKIPADLFDELTALAGSQFVWEKYSEQLNEFYRNHGLRRYARCGTFEPTRLRRWLQNLVIEYNEEQKDKPGFVPFTAHNFRDTAMTAAWNAEIPIDKAAIAFDCNPETMKKHYIHMDQLNIADDVFDRMHGQNANGRKNTESKP